ncbi:MAG: hypothetical protein QOC64_3039, partial [Solirubrobacteraceae bacterium]|nr:hypothetical protein [Solirubrobacteraceae bacterium]
MTRTRNRYRRFAGRLRDDHTVVAERPAAAEHDRWTASGSGAAVAEAPARVAPAAPAPEPASEPVAAEPVAADAAPARQETDRPGAYGR